LSMSDQEVIEVLHDAQQHWKENGLFNSFSIDDAERFNNNVEKKESEMKKATLVRA
jgi:hypothetical protein